MITTTITHVITIEGLALIAVPMLRIPLCNLNNPSCNGYSPQTAIAYQPPQFVVASLSETMNFAITLVTTILASALLAGMSLAWRHGFSHSRKSPFMQKRSVG